MQNPSSKVRAVTLAVLFTIMMFCIVGYVLGIPAWYSVPLIVLHFSLILAYYRKWMRDAEESRQSEIDNISLRRDKRELEQHVRTLLGNLGDHAKFNHEIEKDVETFSRVTGLKSYKTAAK